MSVSPGPAVVGYLRLAREVVRVAGPDALGYLQGQLSQDVSGLGVGASAFSFLLQPQGKVEAFVRVTRVADEELVLDVDAGWGEAVVARLKRFLLRTKAEVGLVDWSVVAVRGVVVAAPSGAFAVPPETPGADSVDLLGPGTVAVPEGLVALDPGAYEALRIRAGVPRMGAELNDRTIPAASGLVDRAVSFTKGCYTGQELVARIDARGDRVPTRLRGIVLVVGNGADSDVADSDVADGDRAVSDGAVSDGADSGDLAVGASVLVAGREVGTITSAAGGVALAYVRREVEPPAPGTVGGLAVRVEALPLSPTR